MERTAALFEKIDDYLNNRLEGDHLAQFEQLLEKDETLQAEVEKYSLVKEALADEDSINFRQMLSDIDQELHDEVEEEVPVIPISPAKTSWFSLKIAAAFVVLLGLSASLWLWSPEEENLFAQYYVPYPMMDITRGETSAEKEILKEVFSSYKNQKYESVISFLEGKVKEPSSDKRFMLYLGNSYMNLGKEKKAIELFKSFTKESPYYRDAQWFMALSYIKLKRPGEAKPILQELSSASNLYKNKALDLYKKL